MTAESRGGQYLVQSFFECQNAFHFPKLYEILQLFYNTNKHIRMRRMDISSRLGNRIGFNELDSNLNDLNFEMWRTKIVLIFIQFYSIWSKEQGHSFWWPTNDLEHETPEFCFDLFKIVLFKKNSSNTQMGIERGSRKHIIKHSI